MCKCTPEIRTPFCGRGDCLPPGYANLGEWLGIFSDAEAEAAAQASLDREVTDIDNLRTLLAHLPEDEAESLLCNAVEEANDRIDSMHHRALYKLCVALVGPKPKPARLLAIPEEKFRGQGAELEAARKVVAAAREAHIDCDAQPWHGFCCPVAGQLAAYDRVMEEQSRG